MQNSTNIIVYPGHRDGAVIEGPIVAMFFKTDYIPKEFNFDPLVREVAISISDETNAQMRADIIGRMKVPDDCEVIFVRKGRPCEV